MIENRETKLLILLTINYVLICVQCWSVLTLTFNMKLPAAHILIAMDVDY